MERMKFLSSVYTVSLEIFNAKDKITGSLNALRLMSFRQYLFKRNIALNPFYIVAFKGRMHKNL